MGFFALIAGLLGAFSLLNLTGVNTIVRRKANRFNPVEKPNAANLIDALRLGYINEEMYNIHMSELGFNTPNAKLLYANSKVWGSAENLIKIRLVASVEYGLQRDNYERTIQLNDSVLVEIRKQFYKDMYRLGFDEDIAEEIWISYRPFPSFSDFTYFLAKEGFEPLTIETFGLHEGYPNIFNNLGIVMSIPENERHLWWDTHWILPSNTQFNLMWQRFSSDRDDINGDVVYSIQPLLPDGTPTTELQPEGHRTLTPEGKAAWAFPLDNLILSYNGTELPKYFHKYMTSINFLPINFSTLQGMYVYGLYPDPWFLGRLRDYGYNPGDARVILEFWRRKYPYASKAPLADNMIQLYYRGEISEQICKDRLAVAGVPNDAIDFVVAIVSDKRFIKKEKITISALRTFYSKFNPTDDVMNTIMLAAGIASNRGIEILENIKLSEYGKKQNLNVNYIRRILSAGKMTPLQAYTSFRKVWCSPEIARQFTLGFYKGNDPAHLLEFNNAYTADLAVEGEEFDN